MIFQLSKTRPPHPFLMNQWFELSHLCCIEVHGEHAFNFLQGQLTCDLRNMKPNEARHGALCNIQGRILALFDVIYHADTTKNRLLSKPAAESEVRGDSARRTGVYRSVYEDSSTESTKQFASAVGFGKKSTYYSLIFLQSLSDIILKTLTPVAQLSRVTLMPSEQQCIGYYGSEVTLNQATSNFIHLGTHTYLVMTSDIVSTTRIVAKALKSSSEWDTLRLLLGHIQIYPHTSGQFLPHHLGLHRTGHISFDKGCYRGQEIIARMHYKSTLKREVHSFTISSNQQDLTSICPGQKLLHPTETHELGEIIDCCLIPSQPPSLFMMCSVQKHFLLYCDSVIIS